MDQTDAFLAVALPRLRHAETALHNGDAGPRMAMWSHGESVTLFGGVMGGSGWAEIEPIFQRLGASFSDCQSYDNEVIAAGASDDLAYTVAYEHTTASVHGGATSGLRAARHHGVPPRGRRVEGRAPTCRPVGITRCRRRPPAARIRCSGRECVTLRVHPSREGRRGANRGPGKRRSERPEADLHEDVVPRRSLPWRCIVVVTDCSRSHLGSSISGAPTGGASSIDRPAA